MEDFTLKRGLTLALLLIILFALLTLTVQLRAWASFDWDSLLAVQNALPRVVDLPSSILTLFGSVEVTGVIFLALVILARPAQRLPLVLTMGVAMLIEIVGKSIIQQPTTPHYLVRYVMLIPLISGNIDPGFSFPSGHAIRTTFIAIVLISFIAPSRLSRNAKIALYAMLLIFEMVMLFTRVYLAEHWASDVIGGAILGAALALLSLEWKISLPRIFARKSF